MREIRQSGSEGGVADNGHPYPYKARSSGVPSHPIGRVPQPGVTVERRVRARGHMR